MDLDQVIELFEDKHTADLADRHAQSISQLCAEMSNELSRSGFYYEELDKVEKVLLLVLGGLQNEKVSSRLSPLKSSPPTVYLPSCFCLV